MMPSIRNHKGRFDRKENIKKTSNFFTNQFNRSQSQAQPPPLPVTDHTYHISDISCSAPQPSQSVQDDIGLDDDLWYIPTDIVPLHHYRFVTELGFLAEQLEHCNGCGNPLSLKSTKGVRCYGVTGIVYIICPNPCGELNKIKLGKVHHYSDKNNQKRGLGIFDVNTKAATGVASLIGKQTGKVVSHKLRISGCKICETAKMRGVPARQHHCRKNWSGSAMGMEPDMVVEMLKELNDSNIEIKEVVGDDDSTGFDRAKRLMPNSKMVKLSDKNHIQHSIICKVNKLKPKHKELSSMVGDAVVKNFSYAINQNIQNPQGIQTALEASVNHMFGDHNRCDIEWCGYLKDPQNYKHSNLPHGKDLTSNELKSDLTSLLVDKMGSQSEKLSNLGSLQANESLNNMIALHAPKTKHFSSSASLNYRVSSAVLQKNEGHTYISKLNESMGLSPGNETVKRGHKLNRKRDINKNKSTSREGKRRRRELKKKRKSRSTLTEIKEGHTYQSGIGLEKDEEKDIDQIPNIPEDDKFLINGAPIVCFDLETTGLSRYSDIVQIAAASNNMPSFESYIFPDQPMTAEASSVTNITIVGKYMYYNGCRVDYKLKHGAMNNFLVYLSTFKEKPVLVGHNIKRFNCHILYNLLKSLNMWEAFCSSICAFLDTLYLFKKVAPGLQSYSQSSLVGTLLHKDYESHNAVHDTKALLELIYEKGEFGKHCNDIAFSSRYPQNYQRHLMNLKTFSKLIEEKAISRPLALKASRSNLRLVHFKLSIQRGNFEGLYALLSEKSSTGIVRVTKNRKTVQKIYDYLSKD